jgi:hypothetical protein
LTCFLCAGAENDEQLEHLRKGRKPAFCILRSPKKKALNSLERFAEISPPLGAGNCKERGKNLSDAWQKTNYISCLQTITLWPGIIFFLGFGGVCRWEKNHQEREMADNTRVLL